MDPAPASLPRVKVAKWPYVALPVEEARRRLNVVSA
jgi:hypothetical protein